MKTLSHKDMCIAESENVAERGPFKGGGPQAMVWYWATTPSEPGHPNGRRVHSFIGTSGRHSHMCVCVKLHLCEWQMHPNRASRVNTRAHCSHKWSFTLPCECPPLTQSFTCMCECPPLLQMELCLLLARHHFLFPTLLPPPQCWKG